MIILKWVAYILALSAFIWYVFLRDIDLSWDNELALQADVSSQIDADTSEDFDFVDSIEYAEESEYYAAEETSDDVVLEEEQNEPDETQEVQTEVPVSETPKAETNTPEEVVSERVNTDASFLLVVGSFGNKNNANRLLNKVKNEYPRSTVTYLNGLNRVVVSSYDNEEDAETAKAQYLRKTGGSAFVLAQ